MAIHLVSCYPSPFYDSSAKILCYWRKVVLDVLQIAQFRDTGNWFPDEWIGRYFTSNNEAMIP